jgi:hypothetical protein
MRRHCLNNIREVFNNYDFQISTDELLNTALDGEEEFSRIAKLTSENRIEEIKEYPEIMEKSIFNFTIREAKDKNIDRQWGCPEFKWLYKNNYNKIMGNINYNKNADFVLNNLSSMCFCLVHYQPLLL